VLIPTYNGVEHTKRCIESLENSVDRNYSVILIDNGSTDETTDYARSKGYITVIENGTNLGFARALNIGIAASDPNSDIVLLNNDVLITDPLWLSKLQRTAYSDLTIGIVGCRNVDGAGRLLHAGTFMPIETLWGQQIGGGEEDVNQYCRSRIVEGVVLSCAYIKREVIDKIGPLDEDYFAYFEDTDYCLRASQQGFKVFCDGTLTVTHFQNTTTSINKMDFSSIFKASQKVFREKWLAFLKNRFESKVVWHSIAGFRSGYSVAAKALMKALDESGVYIVYRYLYGPGTVFPVPEPTLDDYRVSCFKSRRSDSSLPQVVFGQGDLFHKNFGSYKVGYTMLEVDGLPAEWVRQANRMDEIWVPSNFNKKTFSDSGVSRPIFVMPLGVDPDYFNPAIKSFRPSARYCFLSVFEWGERKAPELLFRAFTEEFDAAEDAMLLCEIQNRDGRVSIHEEIARMRLREGSAPITLLLNKSVPRHQMGCLYRSADCFVTPTRGEGFGLPIIEAMACGLPVIATNWGAHTDFFDEGVGYPIKVKGLIPAKAKCPYYEGFRWAEPDIDHLRLLMRHVYQNQDEAREKGLRASERAIGRFSWLEQANRIKARLVQLT
jgi:hypothetical protein